MTSYTTTNATSAQWINLPSNTYGVLNNNTIPSYTTSSWSYTYDENGAKIVEQIVKVHHLMIKYAGMINGVIFNEILNKLKDLFTKVSCEWGIGAQGSLWPTISTWGPVYPSSTWVSGTTATYSSSNPLAYTTYTHSDQTTVSNSTNIGLLNMGVSYTY